MGYYLVIPVGKMNCKTPTLHPFFYNIKEENFTVESGKEKSLITIKYIDHCWYFVVLFCKYWDCATDHEI